MSGLGFVGPLEECDQDRCPLCGCDPLDPTLHGPTCRTVTENLCGVMKVGHICMRAEHMPERTSLSWSEEWWKAWTDGHEWVALAELQEQP